MTTYQALQAYAKKPLLTPKEKAAEKELHDYCELVIQKTNRAAMLCGSYWVTDNGPQVAEEATRDARLMHVSHEEKVREILNAYPSAYNIPDAERVEKAKYALVKAYDAMRDAQTRAELAKQKGGET